ncbi:type VI secretion system baseplate subunit TssG [Caballeronia zhejiangensis]|uniref:type VI secretion system baseplate subunit TssG n=1 Tax=Caballeronia zhejiangensis TaxID=871203 RepID=UPI00158BE60F|nr:type VI secretion system baseplate subunit TssG [Caballeronia zhejiangensis]
MSSDRERCPVDFYEYFASTARRTIGTSDFPLQAVAELRSFNALGFPAFEMAIESSGTGRRPIASIAFLTLAGLHGPLPTWVTEKIQDVRDPEAQGIHAFLDLLNRRFWELLFIAHAQGSRPHLGIQPRGAALTARLLGALTQAHSAGLQRFSSTLQAVGFVDVRGFQKLIAYLGKELGATVWAKRAVPVRLATGNACRSNLGQAHLARAAVIGTRARLACGVRVFVDLTRHEDAKDCVERRQKLLVAIVRVVRASLRKHQLPVMLRIAVSTQRSASCLGSAGVRLGQGACLGIEAPVSQLLDFSHRWIARTIEVVPTPARAYAQNV